MVYCHSTVVRVKKCNNQEDVTEEQELVHYETENRIYGNTGICSSVP